MATDAAALMIDSVFLAKLIASDLYGPPVEGLSDRLKERAPNGLTERALLDAAETIMRAHGSGAFPKLPACLRAIEEAIRTPHVAPADNGFASSGVTKENYQELAIAHGRRVGGLTVIRPKEDPEAWSAWRAYYGSVGMKGSELMMVGASSWTVPSKFPQHFDTGYTPRRAEQRPAPVVGERKTSKQIDDARNAMRAYTASQKPPKSPEAIKAEAEAEARRSLIMEAAAKSDKHGKPDDPNDPVWAKLAAENAALSDHQPATQRSAA